MKTYIINDTMNVFYRSRHITRGDLNDRVGMSIHVMLNSVRKAWRDFNGTHAVFCLEGRSWRKDVYGPYKANRKETRDAMTPKEQEEDKVFFEAFDDFKQFIAERTNCTVLHHPRLEGDDLIGGWVQSHPNDRHIINSTDGDFAQLIAPNVVLFNGVTGITTTHEGYFDEKGRPVKDKKTKEVLAAPDPEWLLFEKCMRGDSSDNIFSAYPGVRTKGTKNKVGLTEAFEDRNSKGYNWNNLMLQKWVDHEGVEQRVKDCYERNKLLCDLTAQPADIRNIIGETVAEAMNNPKDVSQVGIRLLKFCAEYNLVKVSEQAQSYSEPLNARYV